MVSHWHSVVVESADPARLGRWWAQVLDYRILGEDADQVSVGAGDEQPGLTFTRRRPSTSGNGGMHLDVWTDDCDAQVERLVNMGARHIDVTDAAGRRRILLADPEGNRFSVTERAARATAASPIR